MNEKIIVSVDALPEKARSYLSVGTRYYAEHIEGDAYRITADNNKEIIINPKSDKFHLKGMAWNVEVAA